ncbi:hypothetical protein [Alteromonas sp. a30]|uniref:hypothetical protein n=1 Tax=Alteromonas sp. a30 TaxID=2730917 RepID=UPI0022817A1B|nr:hypothetical protein [Alteromonas sp. a30]MCY7297146.1 hypothetical protein [Alteromonas sp. a30]
MPQTLSSRALALMISIFLLLLSGCKDKYTWQEKLCVQAIQDKARYGYDIHEVNSKKNKLLKTVTDVTGLVTVKDGFGKEERQSFRCSIDNSLKETKHPEQVRVWMY